MKESYLLLEEPWIPAVDFDGKRQFFGIRPLLEQAHTLRAVLDASPLVEYGLYRLLCVFLMDALHPKNEKSLKDLLDKGRFDMDAIDAYISLCGEEGMAFDLFDEERPFLQTPYRAEWDKTIKPASILDYTIPSGNNHTHFDHRSSQDIAFSYAHAARLLPAALLFCTACAQGYPSGVNGAPPYFALIRGENLFETLVFSLLDRNFIRGKYDFDQPPVYWRNTETVEPKKIVLETSWLFGMLFPTRRILLIPEPESKTVRQIYLSQGENYQIVENWTDPHAIYYSSQKGRAPLRPNQEKAVWHSLNNLFNLDYAPQTVRKFKHITSREYLVLRLYGVQTNQGSYLAAAYHDMRLPVGLLGDAEIVELIDRVIKSSELLASALRKVLQVPDISQQTVSQAVQSLYDFCERELWNLIDTLEQQSGQADFIALYAAHLDLLLREARDVLNRTLKSVQLSGKSLIQVTNAEGLLYGTIKKRKKEAEIA